MSQESKKLTAKELKRPDHFQVRAMKFMDWLHKNAQYLALAIIPIILVIAGIYGWQYYQETQKNERLAAVGQIQIQYDEEEKAADKEREAIQMQVSTLASASADKTSKDKAANDTKRKELENKLTNVKADHSKSLEQFRTFYEQHPNTPEGWHAGMMAVNIFVGKKDFEKAKELTQAVIDHSTDSFFYQTQARFLLVSILEEQGEFDAALTTLQKLEDLDVNEVMPRVLLTKARLQLLKKADADAKLTISQILEKHADSPEAQKAKTLRVLVN